MIYSITNISTIDAQTYVTSELSIELASLSEQIQSENYSNLTANSNLLYNTITNSYINNISELNSISHIEIDTYFIDKWIMLYEQITNLEKQQTQTYTNLVNLQTQSVDSNTTQIQELQNILDERNKQIFNYYIQMDDLEQQNIDSLKIDPILEYELRQIELILYSKYLDTSSINYVGLNPVDEVYVDYVQQKTVLRINPNFQYEEQPLYDLSIVGVSQNSIEKFGLDTLKIDFELPKLTSCDSQTVQCTPLIGGIELGRTNDPGEISGTLSYTAVDSNGLKGFVIPAHVANYHNNGNIGIKQPHDGPVIGTVNVIGFGRTNLDFAFVESNKDVSNSLFRDSNQNYTIIGYADANSVSAVGSILHYQGISSGFQTGMITGSAQLTGITFTSMSGVEGDSGAPVFKQFGSSQNNHDVVLYGYILNSAAEFSQIHRVIDQYEISPLTLIPSWIKEHAKEWSANNLSDGQYADNIEFLSNAGIINIDATRTGNDPNIPSWIKDSAGWWSQGLISDREHADALQYLVQKGIITLGISVESSTIQSLLTLAEQTDTYSLGDVTITPISNPSHGCEPNCYSPSVVTVDAGSTITFSNTDDLPHSFISGTPYTGPDGSWNSGIVFGGNDYSITLHNPGTYNYYSLFDSWMQGTIIVNDPASPPTSNDGVISALR